MKSKSRLVALLAVVVGLFAHAGCASGVGAECTSNDQCDSGDDAIVLSCLTAFKGGYCGVEGCMKKADCPENSACIAHDDGKNYCFRICTEKAECNLDRGAEVESNCSDSISAELAGSNAPPSFSGPDTCVPPSGK